MKQDKSKLGLCSTQTSPRVVLYSEKNSVKIGESSFTNLCFILVNHLTDSNFSQLNYKSVGLTFFKTPFNSEILGSLLPIYYRLETTNSFFFFTGINNLSHVYYLGASSVQKHISFHLITPTIDVYNKAVKQSSFALIVTCGMLYAAWNNCFSLYFIMNSLRSNF